MQPGGDTTNEQQDDQTRQLARLLPAWVFVPKEPVGLRFLRRNWSWKTDASGLADFDIWCCV